MIALHDSAISTSAKCHINAATWTYQKHASKSLGRLLYYILLSNTAIHLESTDRFYRLHSGPNPTENIN